MISSGVTAKVHYVVIGDEGSPLYGQGKKGSKQLKMTDFGVRPPTLMMGTMKVHDPVKVSFDVLLKP